jgi:hypothetical protein
MPLPRAIHDYLEDHLDGRLTAEGMAVVSAWADESPANAEALAEWWLWQVQVRDFEQLQDFRDVFAGESRVASAKPMASDWNRGAWAWAAAASIAMVAMGWAWWASRPDRANLPIIVAQTSAPNEQAAIKITPAAYLGRMKGCQWTTTAMTEGNALASGSEFAIDRGNAELIFDTGARVFAQGPCKLVIDDASSFTLMVGDVSVEASFGFKVTTPSGVVLDLGTAFGVSVDDRGGSEVHVFEGEVAFQAMNPGGASPGKSVVLQKDQALRYSVGGVTLDAFQANESKFAWRHSDLLDEREVPKLDVRDGLALWLAADRFVEVDDQGGVECWRDLLVAPNVTSEDALQPAPEYRPVLTEDGLNGRPSVRFGGQGTFLLTPPLYTSNDQTAIVVCALNDANLINQQILNYNGPPQRTVQESGERMNPGVFQLIARDGDADGVFGIVGHVFSGHKQGTTEALTSEAISTNRMHVGEPLVIAFRHSPEDRSLTIFVNGQAQASTLADVVVGGTSRKVFGRHPIFEDDSQVFGGDIGELLIYNRALSDKEIASVSDYLMERFGLGK